MVRWTEFSCITSKYTHTFMHKYKKIYIYKLDLLHWLRVIDLLNKCQTPGLFYVVKRSLNERTYLAPNIQGIYYIAMAQLTMDCIYNSNVMDYIT